MPRRAALLALCLLPGLAFGQAEEEQRLAEERVALARQVQGAEARLAAAEARGQAASDAATAAQARREAAAAAFAPLVPVLLRLSAWPAETILAAPGPSEEALQGLGILQGLARRSLQRAEALRLAELSATEAVALAAREAAAQRQAEAVLLAAIAALEPALASARERRARIAGAAAEAAQRAATLAAQARDLPGALARLRPAEAARPPPLPEGPAPRAVLPVAGRITRGFGAPAEGGPSQGISLAAAPAARVTSPCAGRVVFAGPFRSFGLLLIVDCGDGYHFVLAGLDRLDSGPGQQVLAGEPVGQLPRPVGRAPPLLYLELRRQTQPIDPRAWFVEPGAAG